ncbi:MAG: hypothetical protein ACYS0E_20635, partial [Planctomycetota bacterium]
MDFWAQHKDFILKVLAGFGVFLVALIARSVVQGDDLEKAESKNKSAASQIRRRAVIPKPTVAKLRRAADMLAANTATVAAEFGFDATDEKALQRLLLERVFDRIVKARELTDDPKEMARRVQQALAVNLNGAFGALRLRLREEMVDEAAERNVTFPEDGLGFGQLVSLESADLTKYLLQLELVSRIVHDCLGMKVVQKGKSTTLSISAIEEVRIDSADETSPAIAEANPAFLREYVVRFRLRGKEAAILELLNRLEEPQYGPRVTIRAMKAE